MIKGESADPYIHLTKWLEEWDYGDYEGMTLHGIKEARMKEFGDAKWDIWTDGCPGGEYVLQYPPFIFPLFEVVSIRWWP